MADGLDVESIYRCRFAGMHAYRQAMWQLLYDAWFSRFIPPGAVVVEIGAGHCEFINAVKAARRIAVDLNPDTEQFADEGVDVLLGSATSVPNVEDASVDVVLMSNVLEHLSRPDILATLNECHRMLKRAGRIVVLQPNIRYISRDYWMFFDHVTPIDDRALCEVLAASGFDVKECIPRFLPFTTKSRMPKALGLVRLYLRLPILWRFFGGQAFVVAEKP